ncbi:MAG TPA: hypothetical protein VIV60_34500, partial [Polyangiaceae bacterium]
LRTQFGHSSSGVNALAPERRHGRGQAIAGWLKIDRFRGVDLGATAFGDYLPLGRRWNDGRSPPVSAPCWSKGEKGARDRTADRQRTQRASAPLFRWEQLSTLADNTLAWCAGVRYIGGMIRTLSPKRSRQSISEMRES